MEVEINICWNGSLRSLNEAIHDELSRVTEGKYKRGTVIHSAVGDYFCGDRHHIPFNYHRKLTVRVEELYG